MFRTNLHRKRGAYASVFRANEVARLPHKTQYKYNFTKGLFSDPVYSKIKRGNFKSYFNAFKSDAKRHGVDLSRFTVSI